MPKKGRHQIAAGIVAQTTGTKVKEDVAKNPAAVELGRLGGLKGGKARAAKLSPEDRARIASVAAQKRWSKKP